MSRDQSEKQIREKEYEPMKPKLKIIYKGLQNIKEFVPKKLQLNKPVLKYPIQNEIGMKS